MLRCAGRQASRLICAGRITAAGASGTVAAIGTASSVVAGSSSITTVDQLLLQLQRQRGPFRSVSSWLTPGRPDLAAAKSGGGSGGFGIATGLELEELKTQQQLQWNDSADRHVPWPNRKRSDKEKENKKNRRSFKLRSEKYLKPFTLDIFLSNRFVHATIMHRAVHKVVAVANSNAKVFRGTLPAYGDIRACWVIGKVLADRAKEADVYTVVYEPRRGEKLDNKIMTIVNTLVENGIAVELDKT